MSACSQAFQDLQNDPDTFSKALDAYGKFPAGFLTGNTQWLGDYDECVSIPTLKYCSISLAVISATNTSVPTNQTSQPLQLNYGVCVPEVCSSDDIIGSINNVTSNPALPFDVRLVNAPPFYSETPVNCQEFPQRPFDAGFICFTIFCSLLLLLVILGTAFDLFIKHKRKRFTHRRQNAVKSSYGSIEDEKENNSSVDDVVDKGQNPLLEERNGTRTPPKEIAETNSESNAGLFQDILLCFAFNRNLSKLLDTSQNSDRSIGCLNGMRVISLSWVILGHTFIFILIACPENMLPFLGIMSDFSFQSVANAYSSVDTFFFMSGFLVAYINLSRMEKSGGKISLLKFYFHRIWRLTPLYAFVILFSIYYHPYFGSGPMWHTAVYLDKICEKYWWRNLLYINNFYTTKETCMLWSWYMPNDIQFYIISPLILIALYRSRVLGMTMLSSIMAASLITTSVLIGYYHLEANPYGTIFGLGTPGSGNSGPGKSYIDTVYYKPYCRIAPYLVGMAMGYMMNKQMSERRRIRLSKITVTLGWAIATAIGLAVIYGTYSSFGEGLFESVWSTTENVLYGGFSRLGWSLALSWVLFACYYGYGGWINTFLSWSFWTPLSRLTYSAYLIHGFVVITFFLGYPTAYHSDTMSASYIFCGCLLITYASAALFSLLVEYPCAGLEKLMFRSNSSRQTKSNE